MNVLNVVILDLGLEVMTKTKKNNLGRQIENNTKTKH
jgi:hypothetical protein